ncbi:MAG: BRO family protein [Lactobacillus iners]|nr:BRO family protein [Lactobacillus iners]
MENMESGIQTFYFKNEEIKIKLIDNEPYFNLEDVCKILEIKNPRRAMERLLDKQGIYDVMTFTLTGYTETNFISKPNLNKLISHSHRREKTEFAVWLASEVLLIFTRDKMIKNLEELRTNDLEKLIERNSLK